MHHLRFEAALFLASLIAVSHGAGCGGGDTSGNGGLGGAGGATSGVTSNGGAPGVTATSSATQGSTSSTHAATGTTGATSSTHAATSTSTTSSTHAATSTSTAASSSGTTSSTHAATSTTATTSSSSSSSSASSTSGGPPPTCNWDTTTHPGSSTEYYFGQGTTKNGSYYQTACGYFGTESGGGFSSTDTVLNIANSGSAKSSYFVAIPGNTDGSWPVNDCGACIEFIGKNGTKVIATVIDECPTNNGQNQPCTQAGHLDLSTQLFGATTGDPNSGGNISGGSWKFIACPITTDIMIHFNNGYMGQIYIQNMVYPIKSASVNGQAMTQSTYGYWSAGSVSNLAGAKITLTDVEGHTVTGTIPSSDNTTGASIGVQFPSPGTCPL